MRISPLALSVVALVCSVKIAPAFDPAEFWREPQIAFEETAIDQGRERGRPAVDWRSFTFVSENYRGQPMRVFAFYARPSTPGKHPAVISFHGGVDGASLRRALDFAHRGYCCFAFDWLPQGATPPGAPQSRTVYTDVGYKDWGRMFSDLGEDGRQPVIYRAVTAARRAITWLGQQKEVDTGQIAVEGHSWGGMLAQLTAGVDDRVKAVATSAAAGGWMRRYVESARGDQSAVLERPMFPVTLPNASVAGAAIADAYFLGATDAIFVGHRFNEVSPWGMFEWSRRYDPAAYAGNLKVPFLLRLGASDFFGSVDGLGDYWPQITATKTLQLLPAGNHTFGDVETRVAWFDQFLKGQKNVPSGWPEAGECFVVRRDDGSFKATVAPKGGNILEGQLCWTTSSGGSVARQWSQQSMTRDGLVWTATFAPQPGGGALRVFASFKTEGGNISSTLPAIVPMTPTAILKPAIGSLAGPYGWPDVIIKEAARSPVEHPEEWAAASEQSPIAMAAEMAGKRSASLRTLWDEANLYLRVVVADSTPWQPVVAGQNWWDADSVHFRIASGTGHEAEIVHVGVYNDGREARMVAMRGADIKQVMPQPGARPVMVEAGENGYTLVLRLPWSWIDVKMKPAAGSQFRLALLFSDSDLLTGEPILGGNFNNGHALFTPENWGVVTLK